MSQNSKRIEYLESQLDNFPAEWELGHIEKRFPPLILEPEDATYISSIIFELTDVGIITSTIEVKPSKGCIIIMILVGVASGVGADFAKRGLDNLINKIRRREKKRLDEAKNGTG
jgi:hypothetical protein